MYDLHHRLRSVDESWDRVNFPKTTVSTHGSIHSTLLKKGGVLPHTHRMTPMYETGTSLYEDKVVFGRTRFIKQTRGDIHEESSCRHQSCDKKYAGLCVGSICATSSMQFLDPVPILTSIKS